jgi:hypothetical protein
MEYSTIIDEDYPKFQQWLEEIKYELKPATIRLYRAALNYHLPKLKLSPLPKWVFLNDPHARPLKSAQMKKKTSSMKSKFLKEEAVEELIRIAKEHRSEKLHWAVAMILAGRAFGLRPSEWWKAQLFEDQDGLKLRVKNAKHSHGRSFGEYRTLWIVRPEEIQKEIEIARWIIERASKMSEEEWSRHQKHVKDTLLRVKKDNPVLRKKPQITLYSARHQFASDAKKNKIPEIEVAAMMGHARADTHLSTYGKARKGKSGNFPIMPDPKDVAKVEALEQERKKHKAPSNAPSWL